MSEHPPAGDLQGRFHLQDCLQCSQCTQRCPSARRGGVRPDEVVAAILENQRPEGIWDCLLCHRCLEVCPSDIDIVMLMTNLRHRSALAGVAPDRFLRTGAILVKEGRGFPANPRVQKQREELGLPPLVDSDRAMRELGKIISRTRFAYER